MPLRSTRYYWLKIAVSGWLALQLWGCAAPTREPDVAVETDQAGEELAELFEDVDTSESGAGMDSVFGQTEPAEAADDAVDVLDEIAAMAPEPVLPKPEDTPTVSAMNWRVVTGAPQGNFLSGVTENRFVRPVAIAVRSEYVYVVDEGANALYRYDLASGRMEALLDLRTEAAGEVDDIYVAKDFSFYLTDTAGARVIHYDRNGNRVQEFRNHFNLTKPVAVTALDNGDVIVADGHFDHLLHFNAFGKLIATYGGRGQGVAEFINITAMTQGPDGYYVGARIGRRVQVIGRQGDYLYAFEEGGAVFPMAIAVDEFNRSFVADKMDNTIKVFDRGNLIGSIGGFGSAPGQFKRITDLWLDENVLYVVDSLNGRIQYARLSESGSLPMLNNLNQR